MRKEFKITMLIFLFSGLLFFALNIVKNLNIEEGHITISPLSKGKNVLSFFTKSHEKPKKIIYGYLPWWSLEKVKYLQLDKITDIAYFGLYLDADGNFVEKTEGADESIINEPGYYNWKNNPIINTLIKDCKENDVRFALTIIAHMDEKNDEFLNCRECWDTLLRNIISELDEKGIKDVNLNFEHAEGTDDGIDGKFAELTKYLNEELDKIYGSSYLVVSAFGDSATQNRVSSDLENLSRNSDGIFIMAYDYHRPASEEIGPVSPIEGPGIDVTETIKDFLTVAPPNKIILGVPYYGYNWLVEDDDEYAKRVEGSDENGFSEAQTYEDVMATILEVSPEIKWNKDGKSPYFTYVSPETNHLRTAYFENADSLRYKYELVLRHNLGGVGIWALGYDGGYTELWDLLYEYFVSGK
jgi:spore germination protein YaaH